MRKIIYLAIFITLLLVPQAAAAPAKFVDTKEYQDLVIYVQTLNGSKNTPADLTQKAEYRMTLSGIAISAKNKSDSLFGERKKYKIAQNKKALKKIYLKYDNIYKNKTSLINSNLKIDLRQLGFKEKDRLREIDREFDAKEKSLTRNLAKLRVAYYETDNAAKKTSIQEKINKKINEIAKLDSKRISAKKDAVTNFNNIEKDLNSKAAKSIKKAKSYSNRKKRKAKRAYSRSYQAAVKSFSSRKTKEHTMVKNLQVKGNSYIDQMPPLTPPVEPA